LPDFDGCDSTLELRLQPKHFAAERDQYVIDEREMNRRCPISLQVDSQRLWLGTSKSDVLGDYVVLIFVSSEWK